MKPTSGTAKVCGCTLGREDTEIRRKIGIVYQQNCLDPQLSVRENLICRGILHGASGSTAKKRLSELCEILSLGDILKKRYAVLSGGQKRRCEIAASLMHTPELLFLDEPTTGLDPATRMEVWAAVENLRQNTGMTVFLTTHYMEEAAKANRIIILGKGHIMANGTPFELKERYASDFVKIYCTESDSSFIQNKLSEQGMNLQRMEYGFQFTVKNTADAIEPVYHIREHINGFEVIQGNMDDVFLNACSRTHREEAL
jgi:multidrug/hemolysin transport system ATP-binding protein